MDMFEYQRNLDSLSFTPEQKVKLAAKAVLAAEQKPQKHSFRILKTAAAAFCLLFALTITAEAAGVQTPLSEFLAPIFGGTVAQTEIIDKIGRPINASDTDNGVTIQADAIIGDAYNLCIVYTIRRDDGTALLPENVTANHMFVAAGGGAQFDASCHGTSYFVDGVPGDSEMQFVEMYSFEKPINHQKSVEVEFNDIRYFDEATEEAVPAIAGSWKFRFDIAYEDTSIQLGGGETFSQDDLNFTITDIRVSPIAIKVDFEVDSEIKLGIAPSGKLPQEYQQEQDRYFNNVEILLTKTDGTVLNMSFGGSIEGKDGKTYCSKSSIFEEIIPLEELASVSVGGVVYPIPNN